MEQEPGLRELIQGLASDVRGLTSNMQGLASDVRGLKTNMQGLASDVRGLETNMQELTSDMNRQFAEVREHLGRHDAQFVDLRRHFDITAEGLRDDISFLAESVAGMATKESVETLRNEMRAEFEDVRVEIRASYASLDRRIGKPR